MVLNLTSRYGLKINSVGNYFKGIGVLQKNGLTDKTYIYDPLYSPFTMFWEKMGPIILEQRKRTNPNYFEFIDNIYFEIKDMENQQKG